MKYFYIGIFKCLNLKCGEIVIIFGLGLVIEEYIDYCLDKDGYLVLCESEYRDIFFFKYFYLILNFFNILEKILKDIRIVIIDVFSLIFNLLSVVVNKIRVVVEILVMEFGIFLKKVDGGFIILD